MKIQRLTFVLFVLLMIFFCSFGNLAAIECSHPSLPEALDALESSDDVTVETVKVTSWGFGEPPSEDDNYYYTFEPADKKPTTGFIILPGGNCDPKAYAPAAHAIAAKRYLTVIVPMPNCVAIGGRGRADKIIEDFEEIENWVIGGHSVGGTAACIYAQENSNIDGVVIWASLSPGGFEDEDKDMKVLTVYGSRDGYVGPEDVFENAGSLPADTIFKEIKGGNHTQFGYFDTTPDPYMTEDNAATITLEKQQKIIVRITTDFLNMISGRSACLAANLLGKEDSRLDIVRQFRDEALSEISMGNKFIEFYYRNSDGIIAVLDKNPTIKESAKKVLEVLVPMIKLLLK
jgi:hypothetical protein